MNVDRDLWLVIILICYISNKLFNFYPAIGVISILTPRITKTGWNWIHYFWHGTDYDWEGLTWILLGRCFNQPNCDSFNACWLGRCWALANTFIGVLWTFVTACLLMLKLYTAAYTKKKCKYNLFLTELCNTRYWLSVHYTWTQRCHTILIIRTLSDLFCLMEILNVPPRCNMTSYWQQNFTDLDS